MREVSPAIGVSVDEFMKQGLPREIQALVATIRAQKKSGKRPRPSAALTGVSKVFPSSLRKQLLDKVAALVDENWCGRSEMCMQFASLLTKALIYLGYSPSIATGEAIYLDKNGNELYRWEHAWVVVLDDLVDGNVDCLDENPTVPKGVRVKPFWGSLTELPLDRKFIEHSRCKDLPDTDVENLWWPDLRSWMGRKNMLNR